jgi:non-specific serine/threonine protein kinase
VHKLICRGTIEEKIDALIDGKKDMAESVMAESGGAEALLTELKDEQLLELAALDLTRAMAE